MCKRGIVSRRDIPRGSVGQIFLMPGSRVAVLTCRSRSEEHTSELQSQSNLVCRLLLEKKKKTQDVYPMSCYSTVTTRCIRSLQQSRRARYLRSDPSWIHLYFIYSSCSQSSA